MHARFFVLQSFMRNSIFNMKWNNGIIIITLFSTAPVCRDPDILQEWRSDGGEDNVPTRELVNVSWPGDL